MMVLSCAYSESAHGCRILRPKDQSCWILVTPSGCKQLHMTRREARLTAAKFANKS